METDNFSQLSIRPTWQKTLHWCYIWLPFLICAGIIFYLSTRTVDIPRYMRSQDKVLHTLAYTCLSACCYRSLVFQFIHSQKNQQTSKKFKFIFLSIAGVCLYGIAIEIYQPYCNRFFEWWDIMVNTIGAILGTFSYYFFYKFWPI